MPSYIIYLQVLLSAILSSLTKEQFANSPDLSGEFMNAVMDSFEAHTLMSKQVLESESVQKTLLEILLGPAKLYEALKERSIR